MPVTIPVVDHAAAVWDNATAKDPMDILQVADPNESKTYSEILQSSYSADKLAGKSVTASTNGFVFAAIEAYNTHHHLTLRPEDVWFSILTQLSFYIKAHSEELRSFFVEHDDKKELEVITAGTRYTVDFGHLAQVMTGLIAKNVKDPALREWVMPSFSTTTDEDRSVAAVLFMGALQNFFTYKMSLRCGIPSVTLLGEVTDWQNILKRLDFIDQLGEEPAKFRRLLQPIIKRMVLSFEQPKSPEIIQFWNTIAHRTARASANPFISGWLTAFCFWNADGKVLNPHLHDAEEYIARGRYNVPELAKLDDVAYPPVDIPDIPPGSASVPVLLDDNGQVFKCTMIAGSAAMQAAAATAEQKATITEAAASDNELTTVQPMSGWWICINKDQTTASEEAKQESAIKGENPAVLQSKGDDPVTV